MIAVLFFFGISFIVNSAPSIQETVSKVSYCLNNEVDQRPALYDVPQPSIIKWSMLSKSFFIESNPPSLTVVLDDILPPLFIALSIDTDCS